MNETKKDNEVRFIRAEAMDRDSLDIQLSNGNIIILETKMILELEGFGILAEDNRILRPKTDGRTLYWQDGPRPVALDEILALISKSD